MYKCIICDSQCYIDLSFGAKYKYHARYIHEFSYIKDDFFDLYYYRNNTKYIVTYLFEKKEIEITEVGSIKSIFCLILKKEELTKEYINKIFDNLIFDE